MKLFFSNDYDKTISDNTLTDVDKNSDKTQLTTAKESLEKLLTIMGTENETLKLENLEEKTTNAQQLIKTYTERIKTIEEEAKRKAEEEAKKKAEEEAKKKAEEAKKKAQNNSSSNGSSNNKKPSGSKNNSSGGGSSSSSSGNRRPSSGGKRYVVSTYTFTSEDGVKTTKITYSDGTIEFIDSDGSRHDITNNGDIW